MKKRSVGLVLSYANTFLNMVTGLFLSSFLLRQLGDTEYGVYQTIASFANYLVLLEFGTGTVMSRNLAACRAKGQTGLEVEKNISTIWMITNFLALLIAGASTIFYFSLDAIYTKTLTPEQISSGKCILIFITIYLLASFYVQTLNGIMLAYEDYTYASSTSIVRIISRTALLCVLILLIKKSIVIAIVDAAINLLLAIFGYIYATKKFKIKINLKNFDTTILKAVLPLSLAIFMQAIVNQANSNVGKFILGVSVGPEEVAIYSVGLYVYSIFASLSTIPVSMYVPQVTKDVISGKDGRELTDTLIRPSRLIVVVSGAVFFGFFAAGRQFVNIVYGEKYSIAWLVALILIAPAFLSVTLALVINVVDAKNKRLQRSFIVLFTSCINIVLTTFLIKRWGIIGVAASTGLSILLQVCILCVYYSKAINIRVLHLFYRTYKGILLYHTIGAGVGFFVGNQIPNMYLSLLASGMTYVIIAFGGYLIYEKISKRKSVKKQGENK